MAKSKRRQKLLTEKRARKESAMRKSGGRSRYAMKKALQARGIFSPNSPFFQG